MRQTARKITTAAIIVLLLAALSAALSTSLSACASHRAAAPNRGPNEVRALDSARTEAPAPRRGSNEVKAMSSSLQVSALDWIRLNWNYSSIRMTPISQSISPDSSESWPDHSEATQSWPELSEGN